MDATLVAVTLISLAMAVTLLIVTWRLMREERRRSSARIAALAADIVQAPAAGTRPAPARDDTVVRLRRERGRQEQELRDALQSARQAIQGAPAPEVTDGGGRDPLIRKREPAADLDLRAGATPPRGLLTPNDEAPPPPHTDMFAVARRGAEPRRLAFVPVVGVLVVGTIIAAAVALGGGTPTGPTGASSLDTAAPLELISLRHTREGQTLAISGLVRNPSAGSPITRVTAVVFLFDRTGAFVTSSRAPLDFQTLAPGDESPFQITVNGANGIGRYRVSFRTDERVVPHVDRRSEPTLVRSALGAMSSQK